MPKPKPLAGVDTLLLLLTQYWAHNKSVFRTEEDRLDYPIITLFFAYISARSAEFVHTSKNAASQNSLGKEEVAPEEVAPEEIAPEEVATQHRDYQSSIHLDQADKDCSDYKDDNKTAEDIPDKDLFDNDLSLSHDDVDLSDDDLSLSHEDVDLSDNDSSLSHDDVDLCNNNNRKYGETTSENQTDGRSNPDSGYSSDRDRFITESEAESCLMEVDKRSDPAPWSLKNAPLASSEERRLWKALYYKDICLWIVQNPKPGERDLRAIEVCLRHHKRADMKPKPYISPPLTDHRLV
jgi:hypothetical protein